MIRNHLERTDVHRNLQDDSGIRFLSFVYRKDNWRQVYSFGEFLELYGYSYSRDFRGNERIRRRID